MKLDLSPSFLADLGRTEGVKGKLREKAQEVADATEQNARIRRYNPTCEVLDSEDGKGVTVWRTEPFASLDEWGSKNGPPSAALRRAVQQAGLKFKESPKP